VQARRTGRRPAGDIGFVTDEIGRAITGSEVDRHDVAEVATRRHVQRTVAGLDAVLSARASGTARVRVAGAVYDVDTGEVALL
jgi:carbonic anhydrase